MTIHRMDPHTFWWARPHDPAAELGYVTFTCDDPQADAWEVKFPRYWVEYGGWCASRNMRLDVPNVAEHSVAEKIRDHILSTRRGFDDLWAEVRDEGRAPYEDFTDGTHFYATAGNYRGHRGFINIRNRYGAAVEWDGEPLMSGTTYPLDLMSLEPVPDSHIPQSMNWLRGLRG